MHLLWQWYTPTQEPFFCSTTRPAVGAFLAVFPRIESIWNIEILSEDVWSHKQDLFGAFEVNTYTASYTVSDKKFVYERNPLHRAFKKGQFWDNLGR